MTPHDDCPAKPGYMPRDCAEAFGDVRERLVRMELRVPPDLPSRLGSMEATLREVREHQKSSIRKLWELGKAAALLIVGAVASRFGK